MKIACIQFQSTNQKKANIHKAVDMVLRAARKGAKLIALPEVFSYRGYLNTALSSTVGERIPGESLAPLMAAAKAQKVFILAGSVYEKAAQGHKFFNTSCFISLDGKIKAVYRKKNLFRARVGGRAIDETCHFLAGKSVSVARAGVFTVGLSVCYDLRFPRHFSDVACAGANVMCVPSAFTHQTGTAHWEILLRARAIENLSYVLAPNQIGTDEKGVRCYGNSMIVGPWGNILARASTAKEEIIYADLNLKAIKDARTILPNVIQ